MDTKQFSYAPQDPTYTHLLLQLEKEGEKNEATLQTAFGYMFEGGVVPEVGDKIEMFCSSRTDATIEINMRVVKA